MNNLIRTLTELQSNSAHQSDLKLLLTTVRDARRHTLDTKLADPFYDSLEGLLHDLRTVTIDNRDAEAFLKPVPRTEYPDYYDVIATPMDLQTMLKKVKAKHYKSKREFQDDLELIRSNCFQYNAAENHPLRLCVTRLKAKAERLLKYITDRKDRTEPIIPGDITARGRGITPKVNGTSLNGFVGVARTRSVAQSKSPSPMKALSDSDPQFRRDLPFPETLAIVRSQAGMTTFRQLDKELDDRLASLKLENDDRGEWEASLEERLRGFAATTRGEEVEAEGDVSLRTHDGDIGEKRKLNGVVDNRPRKRSRMSPEGPEDVIDLWWDAMRSDELIGNGLPTLRHASSDPVDNSSAPHPSPSHRQASQPRKKRRKKSDVAQPGTLLYHMNNNIKTMRKIRTTHAKFAILNLTNEDGNVQPSELLPPSEDVDEVIDEKPWRTRGSGIDIGPENADECLHWAGSKILEHAGFQGSSKMALDVLSGVAADFFLNIGRTIRFLSEKHANRMSGEEIILHTLFESGIARVTELERYVKDDVVRYGARLAELEKKLSNAYSDATTVEAWDDDVLFKEEDEEEEGEFVMGNFADSFGEDFLGLRELGIAAEFGLSSLSVPKKLLKGKSKGTKEELSAAKPSEPPLPFPLPPPFIPIDSENVENQIGLLKPYYQERLAALAAQQPPTQSRAPAPPTNGTNGLPPPGVGYPVPTPYPPQTPVAAPIVLPDDLPSPAHTKLGPLGQVTKSTAAAGGSKKKSKAKAKPDPGGNADLASINGGGSVIDGYGDGGVGLETPASTPYAHLPSESPKKPKPGTGAGSGKKKSGKGDAPPIPAPVLVASA
ncbi:hypothetical protein BXZ70DRAFT_925723 [Cristinia sonorae]|uniref:Bromo domain-containing protein n=1 Tax=Cristinia sonorae TaxID=1940300 RepID=A0A8K0UUB5_9AGAR|nr:hypothetical protein BXZ70DRAFT_925723 [Cristinia sonorae]